MEERERGREGTAEGRDVCRPGRSGGHKSEGEKGRNGRESDWAHRNGQREKGRRRTERRAGWVTRRRGRRISPGPGRVSRRRGKKTAGGAERRTRSTGNQPGLKTEEEVRGE